MNGRGLVTFKVSREVGGWVGMENPVEMMECRVRRGMKELDSRSGGTRDQMEVCLDDNGLLRRGQVIWPQLYRACAI